MKRKLFIGISLFIVIATVFAMVVYAESKNFSDTVPTFGSEIIAEGKKSSSSVNYATVTTGKNDVSFYGWIEYYNHADGQWIKCTETEVFYANSTTNLFYTYAVPFYDQDLRFVIQRKVFQINPHTVTGIVNFG